jgi:hypothetical protein
MLWVALVSKEILMRQAFIEFVGMLRDRIFPRLPRGLFFHVYCLENIRTVGKLNL